MFGSKKKTEDKKVTEEVKAVSISKAIIPMNESNTLSSLVHGTTVQGSVIAESDIRVDGIIKGTLTCSAKLIIGASGLIDGAVKCKNAVIEGRFYGILSVEEHLSVRETAEVIGDITTSKLSVATGAIFDVTCKMIADTKSDNKSSRERETIFSNGTTRR